MSVLFKSGSKIRYAGILLLVWLLTACTTQMPSVTVPDPLRDAQPAAAGTAATIPGEPQVELPATKFKSAPTAPRGGNRIIEPPESDAGLTGEAVSLDIENLPLPAFINEVYGNLLGLSFQLGPGLERKRDLVTLRVAEPVEPNALYQISERVLNSYGVGVRDDSSVLVFELQRATTSGELPLIVTGRTLPNVPVSHRPVFQIVPLHVVSPSVILQWVNKAYQGLDVIAQQDVPNNSVVLIGPANVVRQVLELIELLDRPSMRGRFTLRIEPAFVSPTKLADALTKVLETEGYSTKTSPAPAAVVIIPLDDVGALLIFAPTKEILNHVKRWTVELDQPRSTDTSGSDLFVYTVKNTSADTLSDVLDPIINRITEVLETKDGDRAGSAAAKENLVVDSARNSLIYLGSADAWARLLPVIRGMDVPPKQVLLEVTIAEVTLDESEQFGIEWLLQGEIGDYLVTGGTLGGTGIGGGGFSLSIVNGAGATRLVLNALASKRRVNILSTPRVLVKSGESASIEVGTDVPIITQQTTGDDTIGGDTSILQSVQYRKTGVLMNARPVIYADKRVDIQITQELSSAQPTTTSGIDSPTILTRKVQTNLSLEDGGSVLLGGIISEEGTNEDRGVPVLKDIPGVGALFKTEGVSTVRSEVAILIVPYILDDASQAESITRAFRDRLTESNASVESHGQEGGTPAEDSPRAPVGPGAP